MNRKPERYPIDYTHLENPNRDQKQQTRDFKSMKVYKQKKQQLQEEVDKQAYDSILRLNGAPVHCFCTFYFGGNILL